MKSKPIVLRIEPFVVRLDTCIAPVAEVVSSLYSGYEFIEEASTVFVDFYIKIAPVSYLRGYYRPQVQCFIDGKAPFKPLPISQAYPFFEWSLNWVVASYVHHYLLVHAAVLEKNGQALILCGVPGAGKSTLCAALMHSGWRLFSDEMAVIDLHTNELMPFVRPISLKNQAIDLMRQFAPNAVLGPSFFDTSKGTVAHMQPTQDSVLRKSIRASAKWIVFPKYQKEADTSLHAIPKSQAVIKLTKNAFNANVLGGKGFKSLCALVEGSDCYEFEYSELQEAVNLFADLSS